MEYLFVVLCLFLGTVAGYGDKYGSDVSTKDWILSLRQKDGGWGKDTPRAVVALYFAEDDYFAEDNMEGQLVAKQLEVELSIKLQSSRNASHNLEPTDLALYINALVATCRNPQNFYGIDLIDLLISKFGNRLTDPLVAIALCNSKQNLTHSHLVYLDGIIRESDSMFWEDNFALTLMALSCFPHEVNFDDRIRDRAKRLHELQDKEGSVGNIYTTALVMQALYAANYHWEDDLATEYLQKNLKDGNFGDFLATYLALPAMKKGHLTQLRDVSCPAIFQDTLAGAPLYGSWISMRYSLKFNSANAEYSLELKAPTGSTFQRVMMIAEDKDPIFRFRSCNSTNGFKVYSISGKSNDPENRLYWTLSYADPRMRGVSGTHLTPLPHSRIPTEIVHPGSHYVFTYN